jgi:spore coat protein U-like protein
VTWSFIIRTATTSLAILLAGANGAWALGCVVSATPIVFGTYRPLHPSDAVSIATITYTCSGVRGRVRIGLSRGDSGSFGIRVMHQGDKMLEYNLFMDPTGTIVWGDGTGGSQVNTTDRPANGSSINLIVYGRIHAGQPAATGLYRDNIFVIVDP